MEKRKKGNKKGPKTVLIVCEGYTEENMVISEKNRRKINAVTIVNMKGSAPLEIIELRKENFLKMVDMTKFSAFLIETSMDLLQKCSKKYKT